MSNQLTDLNDTLFKQLDRLADSKITGDKLREEIDRTKAITGVAVQIIDNAKLALEAHRTVGKGKVSPPMLGIEA